MHQDADDLTALERQLAACQPAANGLDTDAMLFAAGQAAAHCPRFVWPVVSCGFAILSAALGAGFVGERSERLSLASRLSGNMPALAEARTLTVSPSSQHPAPDSYLAIRRDIERDGDAGPIQPDGGSELPAPPADQPVLHAWSPDLQP